MKRCNTVEAGFTFLELLIVFSVISILTIMLFPSVHKLKQQSRQATCINNHRQLAIASILYANESMEKLPVDLVKLSTGNYLVPAPQILPEETNFFSSTAYASPTMNTFYNNQYDLLKCPEVEGSIFDSPPVHSYGFNVFITGMRVDLIESATTTVMITDSFFQAVSGSPEVAFRHGIGVAIAAYVDGHVEYFKDIIPPSHFTPQNDSDEDFTAPPDSPSDEGEENDSPKNNNGLGNGGEEGEDTPKGEDPSNPAHGDDGDNPGNGNDKDKDKGNNGLGNGGEESQGEDTPKGEDPSNPAHGDGDHPGKGKNK